MKYPVDLLIQSDDILQYREYLEDHEISGWFSAEKFVFENTSFCVHKDMQLLLFMTKATAFYPKSVVMTGKDHIRVELEFRPPWDEIRRLKYKKSYSSRLIHRFLQLQFPNATVTSSLTFRHQLKDILERAKAYAARKILRKKDVVPKEPDPLVRFDVTYVRPLSGSVLVADPIDMTVLQLVRFIFLWRGMTTKVEDVGDILNMMVLEPDI